MNLQIVLMLMRLLEAYQLIIVAGAVLSWFPMREGSIVSDIRAVLYRITEPYIGIFRKIVGPVGIGGMYMDFSPLIALLVLQVIERIIVAILL